MAKPAGDEHDGLGALRQALQAGRRDAEAARTALAQLFRAYESQLLARADRQGLPHEDAADLVRNALLAAWQGLLHHEGDVENLDAYVSRAFDGCLADYWEARHGRRTGQPDLLHTATPLLTEQGCLAVDKADENLDPARIIEEEDWREHIRRRVDAALDAIRDDLTRRIVRRHVDGHSLAAIASGLGIGLGTVRYRLDKAMPALREALADLDPNRRPD